MNIVFAHLNDFQGLKNIKVNFVLDYQLHLVKIPTIRNSEINMNTKLKFYLYYLKKNIVLCVKMFACRNLLFITSCLNCLWK